MGDLRYGRTVHSLAQALARFGCTLTFISPSSLSMPEEITSDLRSAGVSVTETGDLHGSIEDLDVIYMTRIQKERFPDEDEYHKVAGVFRLSRSDLDSAKKNMIVMHPLPRVDEISPDVDSTSHAKYFEQAFYGVVARMSLLCRLLGVQVPEVVSE